MLRNLTATLFLLALAACGGSGTDVLPATSPGVVPFNSPTPTETITPLPPLVELFLPTPTPLTYIVRSEDTLSAIAVRFSITTAALQAANPGVDPDALPVGTLLVIPPPDDTVGEPSPTPASLPVRQVQCYPESTGGLWCFGLVQNEHAAVVENISALFTLLDASGNPVASQVAYGLLNILPSGLKMPLVAHFTPPLPASVTARMQVLTSILLPPGDARYIQVALQDVLIQMDASGRTAHVSGQVMPLMLDGRVKTLWILGTAYDFAGNVIGVRRWESTVPLAGGVTQEFSFIVYSLGPAIERVELLAEARP